MDLVSLFRLMLRRWRVVLPVMLITLVVAIAVERSVEPVFEAKGSALIATAEYDIQVAPSDVLDPEELTEIVRLSDEVAALTAGPPALDITIVPAAANILQLVVSGDDEAAVASGTSALVDLVVAQTQARQQEAGVESEERVQARPLSDDIETVAQASADGSAVEYTATMGIRFDDPTAGIENPYTASRGTARLLEVAVQSDAARATVEDLTGTTIDFVVSQEEFDEAPILEILAYGPSEAESIEGFDNVVATMGDILTQRQNRAGVPPSAQLSVEVVAAPLIPQDVSPPISRTVAVIIAFGVLTAVGLGILAENRTTRPAKPRRSADERRARDSEKDVVTRTGSSDRASGQIKHEPASSPTGQRPPA